MAGNGTLTAFVRERAPWPPQQVLVNPIVQLQVGSGGDKRGAEPPGAQIRPSTDIQAVLTVLGRRDETARQQDEAAGRRLDLAWTDLRYANLRGAHLEHANLTEAHLEHANLTEAHLEGANLTEAHLEGANLTEAHLEGANLIGACLDRADLMGAHLEGAKLMGAYLEGAKLMGAYLLEHAHLAQAHLESANLGKVVGLTQAWDITYGDDRTVLPDGLIRPAHWPSATPEEPDNAK